MIALARFGRLVASRQDLALIFLLLMIIFMIILPLPTWLIDLLIGVNLSLVLLVLVVTVYLKTPTAFSTLPAVLLFSTLFRLAISISTTRMILMQADAGKIVETFGEFVLGGSLIVGLVVFLIITVVQFVVITKGSERVAEVSARFSLDALPGRQMSIDSDMRAGGIDMAEAKRRRQKLQLESEFYGSMDGAMKFVKGDAIAGLIIIAVNILGGIGVGVGQNGMAFGEAVARYSVLTVGDGLVSQIPALLMAISSGIVITRITADESSDLGRDIAQQMSNSPKALMIAAGVLALFALIPGFPALTFLALGAFFAMVGGIAHVSAKRALENEDGLQPTTPAEMRQDLLMTPMAPVHVGIGPGISTSINRQSFRTEALIERSRLFEQIGVPFPPMVLVDEPDAPENRWRLIIEGVPVVEETLPLGQVRVTDDPEAAQILNVPVEETELGPNSMRSYWADAEHAATLKKGGVATQSPEAVLAMLVGQRLPKHASEFLGVHETNAILTSMEARYDDLVAEAQKALPLQKIALVMRRLVEEEVPIRNMRILLETVVEWGAREKDPDVLSEYVRAALSRQISHKYADPDRFIPAFVVESDVEDTIRGALRQSSAGTFLSLEAAQSRSLLGNIKKAVGDLSGHATMPVFLATMDTRRHLKRFLSDHEVECPVLSHKEIATTYKIQPLSMVSMR
ncbi:MAG: type III secretion system export apparatus subunit SctV [Pseudomonadota bacterium]